jgi:hypothetical protein
LFYNILFSVILYDLLLLILKEMCIVILITI